MKSPGDGRRLRRGLEIIGPHNHFLHGEPKVYFMNVGGEGEQEKLAAAVLNVQDAR